MRFTIVRSYLCFTFVMAVVVACATASAQGTIRGSVTAVDGRPAPGATVHVVGTQLGAIVDSSGMYRVNGVPAGTFMVRVLRLGFAPDSASVVIANGRVVQHDVQLHPSAEVLGSVVVNAQRLGETQASALERRAEAPNVVNVLAGDVIRALPNANAAEAAGRIPG